MITTPYERQSADFKEIKKILLAKPSSDDFVLLFESLSELDLSIGELKAMATRGDSISIITLRENVIPFYNKIHESGISLAGVSISSGSSVLLEYLIEQEN